MHDCEWSAAEKKIARRAFEAALETALAEIMTEFKTKAAAAVTPEDMWSVERFLRQQRREIEETFDYRYSRLPVIFGRLIVEGKLDEGRLTGLSQDKLEEIRRFVLFARRS
jgi:Photoprotection regulator fluorescence recovery protein